MGVHELATAPFGRPWRNEDLAMVLYDWRRCPAQLQPPQGPADYGPLAADIGTRTFGDFPPSPNVEIDSCPESANPVWYLAAGALVMAFMGRKKGL